jgi:hypothetical protein
VIPDEHGEGVEEFKEFKEFELLGNPQERIHCFGGAGGIVPGSSESLRSRAHHEFASIGDGPQPGTSWDIKNVKLAKMAKMAKAVGTGETAIVALGTCM